MMRYKGQLTKVHVDMHASRARVVPRYACKMSGSMLVKVKSPAGIFYYCASIPFL